MGLKKVIDALKRSDNFLITTHTGLEGDALGSALSFLALLKAMGKKAVVLCDDYVPAEYSFLPGVNKIKRFSRNLSNLPFDCFLILDCSDFKRCGGVSSLNLAGKLTINIDHHISNLKFADINWVNPRASSAAEMIFGLYKKLRIPLNKSVATVLYAGLVSDTGSFRYTNTTARTHRIAAELLNYNLDAAKIYREIYENVVFPDIRLLAEALLKVKQDRSKKIAWIYLDKKLLPRKISFDPADYLLNFLRSIKGVEVALLFKENFKAASQLRVNFRSTGRIDVNKIACFFGGGGHKTASAATIKGKKEKVIRQVLGKIRDSL